MGWGSETMPFYTINLYCLVNVQYLVIITKSAINIKSIQNSIIINNKLRGTLLKLKVKYNDVKLD